MKGEESTRQRASHVERLEDEMDMWGVPRPWLEPVFVQTVGE